MSNTSITVKHQIMSLTVLYKVNTGKWFKYINNMHTYHRAGRRPILTEMSNITD